jgi:hypothetical protein
MNGCDDGAERIVLDGLSPLLRHAEALAEQRLGRGSAEADDHRRLDGPQLRVEPWDARLDLRIVRLPVDSLCGGAAPLPLEVLDRVGDVDLRAVDSGLLQRLIEEPAGGPDEGPACAILGVARLLTDEDHVRAGGALAENRLSADLPQVAAATGGGRFAKPWQRRLRGDEVRGGASDLCLASSHEPEAGKRRATYHRRPALPIMQKHRPEPERK